MYENIGKKIKGLAIGMFVLMAIASVIVGIALMVDWGEADILGFLIMLGGAFLSWVLSLTLYGFGELIDATMKIERNTRGTSTKSNAQAKDDEKKADRLEKLRAQGLITEEEYQEKMKEQ